CEEWGRIPFRRRGREPIYGDVLNLQDGTRGRDGEDQKSPAGGTLLAGPYLHGARKFAQVRMDNGTVGRRCERPLRGIEAGVGGPLLAPSRHFRESPRSSISPRGL